MGLKLYVDRMSQPSRAILIFCKMNGIDFEEVKVDISKRQQLTPEFKKINPMGQVPAISDGRFNLFESHAILVYLACAFPGVADHWYPADLASRARINSVLDWHHSNLRRGATTYVQNTVLAPVLGLKKNPLAAAEADKVLFSSLSKIESIWLKGNGKFLLGGFQPSIADLSLVCEIMQLELLDEKDGSRILGPHKKVLEWIANTKAATRPHFEEVHKLLYRAKTKFQEQRSVGAKMDSSNKLAVTSKIDICCKYSTWTCAWNKMNPQAAAKADKLLSSSLSKIESIWLKGNGKFLLGGSQPSIADLSLVCEIMQLELLEEKDRSRILNPHQKVLGWD